MLSDGEFVVRSAIVRQPGVLEGLLAMNRGMASIVPISRAIPSFAEGGAVEPIRSSLDSSMTIGLDDGLVLKALQSAEGQRVLVKTIGKNKRGIRGSLGV
jgi:hypothetical protein